MGEVRRTSLRDVWSNSDAVNVEADGIKFAGVVMKILDKENWVMAAREEWFEDCVVAWLFIAGLVKVLEMEAGRMKADLYVGVVRSANARAGQTKTTVKKRRGGGGGMDCVSERRSSTQLLLFCTMETILSPV